jgi:hypothetical protein
MRQESAQQRGRRKCENNCQRSRWGAGICQHNRIRSTFKDCGGGSICEHNRRRSKCKDCGGTNICQHNRQMSTCKDCGGASICEYNCKVTCKFAAEC